MTDTSEGTETKVAQSVSLFFPGIEAPFPLEYRDLAPSEAFTLSTLRATPFEVDHYSRGVAFGYRVELSGKTVVFSGDTAWTEELVRQSSDADLFVCECSSFDEPIDKEPPPGQGETHEGEILDGAITTGRWIGIPSGPDPIWTYNTATDVQVGVHALVINLRAGFNLLEFLDFLVGFAGFDPAGDDADTSH